MQSHKAYKKKIGGASKYNGGPVDYMKDIPLTFDMDEIKQHSKQVSVKKNSFAVSDPKKEFINQSLSVSQSTQASDLSQTLNNKP